MVYLLFFENWPHRFYRELLVLLSAVTMSLCMILPIKMDSGFTFDLRYIPFLVVALYGGYKNALPLYIILNLSRLYVGGEGVLPSLLFSSAVMAAVPLYHKTFMSLTPKGRVIAASAASFLTMSCYLISLAFVLGDLDQQYKVLAINALTVHTLMMAIIMILIERILANIKSRSWMLQSERLNVVSELAASVSHEIRNPLTVTSGFLQLLGKSAGLTEREKEYIQISLQELRHAEKIVSDFLSFAKPQSANMVYSDLKAELEYTINIILPYASINGVELDFHFSNKLRTSYDRHQFQQCLINLYKNAIEAMKMKGGGTLYIEISDQKHHIVIKVQDNGTGMSEEELSRLGKPYYSTIEQGTGLGMLLVYNTIYKLKGTVEVHSEKGEGTTFLLTIPAQQAVS
ncbi:sensor histidine kinase [Paenibacillus pinistramenti]|uniref:ATP-binding protein n=1 Tax=Paenibacillus pinistramenti TaxID=1768003 RepID=UPI0023AED584|nr:sensor histidine kinase [Paenibacillus pinistramenti]